jgi:hypothetical protein
VNGSYPTTAHCGLMGANDCKCSWGQWKGEVIRQPIEFPYLDLPFQDYFRARTRKICLRIPHSLQSVMYGVVATRVWVERGVAMRWARDVSVWTSIMELELYGTITPLTLYTRKGSKNISDIPRCSRFIKVNYEKYCRRDGW